MAYFIIFKWINFGWNFMRLNVYEHNKCIQTIPLVRFTDTISKKARKIRPSFDFFDKWKRVIARLSDSSAYFHDFMISYRIGKAKAI